MKRETRPVHTFAIIWKLSLILAKVWRVFLFSFSLNLARAGKEQRWRRRRQVRTMRRKGTIRSGAPKKRLTCGTKKERLGILSFPLIVSSLGPFFFLTNNYSRAPDEETNGIDVLPSHQPNGYKIIICWRADERKEEKITAVLDWLVLFFLTARLFFSF